MEFDLKSKVALITGAAKGLGSDIAEQLLVNGLKGIALLDVDENEGQETRDRLLKQFGEDSCIFIKTDVTQSLEFEEAFKKTILFYDQLDIVINNAGVLCELNWRKCLDINLGGYITGTLLAMDTYLPKYKSGTEAVIVNIASITSIDPIATVPVYTATKHGVLGLTRSFGLKKHYERANVKVIGICPGNMTTGMIVKPSPESFNPEYSGLFEPSPADIKQDALAVAEMLPNIIEKGETGSIWVIQGGEPAYEIKIPNIYTMRKK